MNIQKLVVIVIAVVINVLALALFNASTPTARHAAAVQTRAPRIQTLPVIEVHPDPQQMRALRRAHGADAGPDVAAGIACTAARPAAFAPAAG